MNQFTRIPFRSRVGSNENKIIDVDVTTNISDVTQLDNEDDGVSSQLSTTSTLVPNSAAATTNTERNRNVDEPIIEQQAGHPDITNNYFIRRR